MFQRTVSLLMAVIMLISLLPLPAMAEETTEAALETVAEEMLPPRTEETVAQTPEEAAEETTEETAVQTPEETTIPETEAEAALELQGYMPPMEKRGWYLTEEVSAWSEPVTVVEANGDGTYRTYETVQNFQETWHAMDMVGNATLDTLSREEKVDNTYSFTEFTQLEQLAQGSYDSHTVALYTGGNMLVIERDLVLPENLELRISGTDTALVVPAGVTFANASGDSSCSLYVNHLKVDGTLIIRDALWVGKSLTVTGSLEAQNGTLWLEPGVTVSGSEKICVTGGYTPRWSFGNLNSEEELVAAVAAAGEDETGWDYLLEICTADGDVTLNSDLTIPENVQLNLCGDGTSGRFVIASGSTLTLNASYCHIGSPVTVKGSLVNNCAKMYVSDPVTISDGGSYSGDGVLCVDKDHFRSWDAGVAGLSAADVEVSAAGDWWLLQEARDAARLGTPTNLTWNKRVVQKNGKTSIVDAKGHIYWKAAQPDDNFVVVRFYNADTGELQRTWNCHFGGQATADRSVDAFITIDPPAGNYYFTVTSTPGGSDYAESLPATSGTWSYTQTGRPMSKCTNLVLNWPRCSWDDPAEADEDTTHCIEIYYAATADETPYRVESNFGFTGNETQINSSLYQSRGAGYYSFRVRAIPDDISQYRVGEWSEMSQVFYYDPATFAFDETWITEHIKPAPMDPNEDFVFTDVPVKLKNDFTIPEGLLLDIGPGGSITVPAGKTLTVNAQQVSIYNGGKLIVEPGGRLIVNENIYMFFEDGTVDVQGTAQFNNGAMIIVEHSAGVYGGTVSGVDPRYLNLVIWLTEEADYWDEGFAALESSDFGWTSVQVVSHVTLPGNVTGAANSEIVVLEDSSLTVPAGMTLTLPRDAYLFVTETASLTNNGTIRISGGMTVAGTVTNNGVIELSGGAGAAAMPLALAEDGQEPRRGYLKVETGAKFQNSGTVAVNAWSDVFCNGLWEGNRPENLGGNVYGTGLSMTQEEFTAQIAAAKKAGSEYVLNESVLISKSMKLDYPVTVGNNGILRVQSGATLTVNEPLTLYAGADLQIAEGAKLANNSIIYSNTTQESDGALEVKGSYTHGTNAQLTVQMSYGTPQIYGIDTRYQTARFDQANEETTHNAVALTGYAAIEIWSDCLELNSDLTIPANASLILNPSWSDLQNGTRNDWVYLNGNVTVYGRLQANAYYNGTPCNLEINGNVNVQSGGIFYACGNVRNNGNIHVAEGGKFEFTDRYGAQWEGTWPQIDLTEQNVRDALKAGETEITINNPITLSGDLAIPENVRLYIHSCGALTVPTGVTLTLNGWMNIWGGSLSVEAGGKLVLNSGIDAFEDAVVNVQGSAVYNGRFARVFRSFNRGDWVPCTITGIPREYQGIRVSLFGGMSSTDMNTAVDVVENNDYPMCIVSAVEGEVTLPRTMTIPSNTLFHVDRSDTAVVIPEGMTLTNMGEIYVWDTNTLINHGTLLNRQIVNIYGRVENYGTLAMDEGVQGAVSYFNVNEPGYVYNDGTASVNRGARLWMLGTWEGNDPVNNGGEMVMGRYRASFDGADLLAGQSLTLSVWDNIEERKLSSKEITWSLPEEYASYATLSSKGKLTARKVTQQVDIEVIAVPKDSDREVVTRVHLYPAVTHLEILDETDTVINGKTVPVDIENEQHIFRLQLYPVDLNGEEQKDNWCTWTISDSAKKQYAGAYTIENGVLTVEDPTGKAGTVTVKVSCNVGSKKSVSFKLNFGSFAKSVDILNQETELPAGSKLKLVAAVNPRYATKADVTWSLKNPDDKAYVSLSGATLKAKSVYGSHRVTLIATSKDGQASAEYAINIVPKDLDILILKMDGKNVTKTTVNVDLNTVTALNLTAWNFGSDTEETVTWKSSAPKVAMVADGEVQILKKGSATITAACGSRKATVTLKISQMASAVKISQKKTGAVQGLEVASGKTLDLQATLTNAASKKVTWSVAEGSAYAKVSSSGRVTAAKNLTSARMVKIRATAADGSGKYGEIDVLIRPIAQGVQLYTQTGGVTLFRLRSDAHWQSRNDTTLQWDLTTDGNTLDIRANVFPYYEEEVLNHLNAIQAVTWKSSSTKVAQIRTDADGNHEIVCKKPGTVTITATAADGSGKKMSFKLKIVRRIGSLALNDQSVVEGGSLKMAKLIVMEPAEPSNKKLTWKILSGSEYATLSSDGVLKAKKTDVVRKVTVQATAQDGGNASATCIVTIYPK